MWILTSMVEKFGWGQKKWNFKKILEIFNFIWILLRTAIQPLLLNFLGNKIIEGNFYTRASLSACRSVHSIHFKLHSYDVNMKRILNALRVVWWGNDNKINFHLLLSNMSCVSFSFNLILRSWTNWAMIQLMYIFGLLHFIGDQITAKKVIWWRDVWTKPLIGLRCYKNIIEWTLKLFYLTFYQKKFSFHSLINFLCRRQSWVW